MKKYLLSLLLVLGLTACGDKTETPKESEKPVVKIGALYPMSGDGANFGEAAQNAVKLFFDEFNKKEHKFDYQVVFENNHLTLAKQASLAQKLITMDKVDVVVSVLSNFGAVVSPIAEQNKVIHFSVATDPAVSKGFYNLITSSNPDGEADLLYRQLVKKGAKKVDVVVVNATGQISMLDFFKQKVEQGKELEIGQTFYVNADEKDFRIMLYKIKENNPDYIIALLAMPTIDVFMKQYRESSTNIPVTGIETFTYMQNKVLAEGMWYVDAANATDDYTARYQQSTGKQTTDYAEYLDFILQMITLGYEGAGTTDKEKVIDYIQNNSAGVMTAVGKITTEADGILSGQPILKKFVDGKAVIINEE